MAKFMDVHSGFMGVSAQQLKEAHERGYTCASCGEWAIAGHKHECSKEEANQALQLARIAQALERIANILESHAGY